MSHAKLVNAAIVFIAPDVKKTTDYYRDILGFRVVEHFDKEESFAALYRDEIEIIIVQSRFGEVVSNQERYGAGCDAYLDPHTVEGVDTLYDEWKENGAKILTPPHLTAYGSYEFVLEDIDGRRICAGLFEQFVEVLFARFSLIRKLHLIRRPCIPSFDARDGFPVLDGALRKDVHIPNIRLPVTEHSPGVGWRVIDAHGDE